MPCSLSGSLGCARLAEGQEALDIAGMLQDCARQWAAAQSDAESSVLFQVRITVAPLPNVRFTQKAAAQGRVLNCPPVYDFLLCV